MGNQSSNILNTGNIYSINHNNVKKDLANKILNQGTLTNINVLIGLTKMCHDDTPRYLNEKIENHTKERCLQSCKLHLEDLNVISKCGTLMPHDDESRTCLGELNRLVYLCKQDCEKLKSFIKENETKDFPSTTTTVRGRSSAGSSRNDFDNFQVQCKDGKCTITKCKDGNCRSFTVDRDGFNGCDPEGSGVCIDSGHCDYDSGICEVDTSLFRD